MLRIHFGSHPKEIYNTVVYYENQYDKEWVMDEFARRVIRDIDASEVLSPDVISNDILARLRQPNYQQASRHYC